MFGQDSVQLHNQCLTEAEKYGPKKLYNGNSANSPLWFCSLCNATANCEQNFYAHVRGKKHRENAQGLDDEERKQFEQPIVYRDDAKKPQEFEQVTVYEDNNSNQLSEFDINVGLSSQYPWFCSLCNTKATSQQSLQSHAIGNKHRANAERFYAKQRQQLVKADVNVGLSNCRPWFCSLCNAKATSQNMLLSHANGRKHRENVECFNATQLQQSTIYKDDTFESAYNGDFEHKKVDLHVSSSDVAKGYSQADKKRKLETFDETWNEETSEIKSESKRDKKQDHEKKGKKKQTEPDSDFEDEKEDMKNLLLVSYSKEDLVNLVYKTAEKSSRLISAILDSADRDISQRNIFVRGFGFDTTHEHLKAAFESYGEIEDCNVVMDKDTGRSKGYGFIVFKTRKGAREALKNPEKRMYNRIVVCAMSKPCGGGKDQDNVEPMKVDLTQSDVALSGHVLDQRHHQQPMTMEMFRQNMPFYGHYQPPSFDPMYGVVGVNQMVAGLPNYCMFGSGLMNQGPVVPSSHVGMAGHYFGDFEPTWYMR